MVDSDELRTDASWLKFRRNRFSTRLPPDCRYSLSHYWLREEVHEGEKTGIWRIGMTAFATRMLGEIVEFDFEVSEGEGVRVGQELGWIEGFKAVSDFYCVADGKFRGLNGHVVGDPSLICADSYQSGWIYEIEGVPDEGSVDVNGYVQHLELTIDKMLEKPWQTPEMGPS